MASSNPRNGKTSENQPRQAERILLCIPDISGFTRFMSETGFELSSKVIPSLLNKIVYANEIGLKISEIEGDAVLFYRATPLPDLEDLLKQCIRFHTEFYKQLHKLHARYSDNEDAEKIPEVLGIKIILHLGDEVGQVPVGKRIKLIGEDVIAAHRLLKNDIPVNEYILLSDTLLEAYDTTLDEVTLNGEKLKPERGYIYEEHLGKLGYYYMDMEKEA